MSDECDGWDDDNECWNRGGEGRVNHCIDGCCVDSDDIYCDLCSRPCDVCQKPKRPDPALQEVLREALEKNAEPAMAVTSATRGTVEGEK